MRNGRTGEEVNFGFASPLLPVQLLASWPTILPGARVVGLGGGAALN